MRNYRALLIRSLSIQANATLMLTLVLLGCSKLKLPMHLNIATTGGLHGSHLNGLSLLEGAWVVLAGAMGRGYRGIGILVLALSSGLANFLSGKSGFRV